MTERLVSLKKALATSNETKSLLYALYMQDTLNAHAWGLFQTQVKTSVTLQQLILREVTNPAPIPTVK